MRTMGTVRPMGFSRMNITWKPDRPIPAKFLKKTNKLVVGQKEKGMKTVRVVAAVICDSIAC